MAGGVLLSNRNKGHPAKRGDNYYGTPILISVPSARKEDYAIAFGFSANEAYMGISVRAHFRYDMGNKHPARFERINHQVFLVVSDIGNVYFQEAWIDKIADRNYDEFMAFWRSDINPNLSQKERKLATEVDLTMLPKAAAEFLDKNN
ncbi:hypothetical protein [Alkalilimnicola ehrlichii]|uniref:Uncharacterized protein n=1 Tax=Alkalilimnicola ehrlichii TaxID=351052 RepID=A0A3E0WJI2_9GAMM|nr:hypothetical protein [Alkalilimnicola ehrlichii]RFA32938.1 hypothetical protein CAL65_18545 [Alkalilimnicola ehrlichii]